MAHDPRTLHLVPWGWEYQMDQEDRRVNMSGTITANGQMSEMAGSGGEMGRESYYGVSLTSTRSVARMVSWEGNS